MGSRGAAAIAVVLVMMLSAVPLAFSEGTDAVPAGKGYDGILIYEVASDFGSGNEGFALKNYGSSAVDLNGYYLYDDASNSTPHRFTINKSLSLGSGEVVTFVADKTTGWFSTPESGSVYNFTEKGSRGGSFNLTNGGDILQLYSSAGILLDTVVFGKDATAEGWDGPAAYLGNMKQGIKRVESTDTDTYFDWTPLTKDSTSNSFYDVPTFTNVKVTPFIFPDCKGKPIFDAVMSAQTSVCISIYMLTSSEMLSALATLESAGKDVKVLLENKPLGYSQDYERLKSLVDAGGEVSFIGYEESGSNVERYSYVHNKYAIIDGTKVIVTSENWTYGNLGGEGNRGWGAIVESADYASYMQTYFDNDFAGDDVIDFATYETKNGTVTAKSLPSKSAVQKFVDDLSYSTSTYTCDIKMYMSPDNTFKAMQYYIDNAKTRVYTEQMSVGVTYMDLSNISPVKAMVDAAKRGVDCRLLLADTDNNAKTLVSKLNDNGVKAANMKSGDYATMHNKGVIIDDAVWVSSVNWTDNAFVNNRECGLYIMSPEVTQFFADGYQVDWEHDYVGSNKGSGLPVDEKTLTWGAIALVVLLIVLVILYKIFVPKKVQKAVRTVSKGAKKSSGKKSTKKR